MWKLNMALCLFLLYGLGLYAQPKVWSLQQCIEQALQQNIQLRLTVSNNESNSENLYQSRYALYPSLNANANQGFNWGRTLDPSTYQYLNQAIHTNNFSLNSTVPLFAGFQYRNTIKKYELDVKAGQAAIDAEKNTIILNVAGAYLQILLAKEQLRVSRSQVLASQKDVDRTKLMVDIGKTAEANLYQLKSQLATFQSQEIDAENNVELGKLSLQQLMELPISTDFDVISPQFSDQLPPMDTTKNPAEIFKTALQTQPQIKGADLQVESANMYLKVNEGTYYPRLTLGGTVSTGYSSGRSNISYYTQTSQQNIGYLNGNPNDVVTGPVITELPVRSNYPFTSQISDNFAQSLLLTLSIPIFNNMQARTNVLRAKTGIEQAQLNSQSTKNDLRKSVEQAFTDMKTSDKKYAASAEALKYSNLSLQNMQIRFDQGLSTADDLLIQKNSFLQAQSQLLQAKYDYIFKQKVLEFYMGKQISL